MVLLPSKLSSSRPVHPAFPALFTNLTHPFLTNSLKLHTDLSKVALAFHVRKCLPRLAKLEDPLIDGGLDIQRLDGPVHRLVLRPRPDETGAHDAEAEEDIEEARLQIGRRRVGCSAAEADEGDEAAGFDGGEGLWGL